MLRPLVAVVAAILCIPTGRVDALPNPGPLRFIGATPAPNAVVTAGSITVQVDVELTGKLPPGARSEQSVDGTIEIERLPDVIYTGRPTYVQPNSTITLFKLIDDGAYAVRVPVQVGVTSVNQVEIREGLMPGDEVILSDTSAWDDVDRIRLD